jgi:hypothetical protein
MIEAIPPQSFPALREEWQALYARAARRNLFATHAWLDRWLGSFGDSHRVIVDRDREGLTAATVLHVDGARAHHLEDHTYWPEVITRSDVPRGRRRLLEHLHSDIGELVLLGRDDPAVAAEIERDAEGLYDLIPRWTYPMHAVSCAEGFEAYLGSRRSKVRAELKRKDRRFAKELGDDGLVVLGPDQADRAMDAIRTIDAASWKEEAETAIVSNETELRFYERIVALDEEGARGQTYLLQGGGRPRAFVLGVAHDGVYHALKTSYCAEDAKLSPGQVLFYRVIERLCADRAYQRLELLGRDSRWKQELASETTMMRTYALQRRSFRSVVTRVTRRHLLPRLRDAVDDNPLLGEALNRSRETLAAARRLLTQPRRK